MEGNLHQGWSLGRCYKKYMTFPEWDFPTYSSGESGHSGLMIKHKDYDL